MRLGIRFQLLLPLLALMLGVVATSTWTTYDSGQRARRQIEGQIEAIAATVNGVTFPRNMQTLRLMKGLSSADFLLCDAHGQPLEDDMGRPMTTLGALPTSLPLPSEQPAEDFEHLVQVGGLSYVCAGVALRHGAAGRVLYVFYPESLWRDAAWQALRPALFLGVLGGLASAALAVAVTQRLARRIQALERRTRLIAAGDFSPMPLPRRDDELRDLSRSVNDMAGRLAQYRETISKTERLRLLGQVSGGLAHQLRNVATGARLAVQLHARSCPDGRDDETLGVALRQLALVETHLKRFLDLGKALELRREPRTLHALVTEALALLDPQCRHAGITLIGPRDDAPTLPVSADAEQIGQLLVNVLTNAIEAAGPGGRVEVRLFEESGRGIVEVIDSGAGPAPEVAARLFEPFVTGKPEGVGLGLAVARQVAEAHGGALGWRRAAEGTCFRVELPLEEVAPTAAKPAG